MTRKWTWLGILTALCFLFVLGCSDYGKVDQGRVVKYDKDKKTVIIIRDKKNDTQNPDYTYLPPLTYSLPTDPAEMGPEPKAGGRMKLDTKASQIVIFDPASQGFKTIDIKILDQQENVEKNHPLVQGKTFPAVDKDKKTVTIYSGRQKLLVTFGMPDEFFAMPDATWDAGDEVRIYYKEEGKSLRFMNVSKTDIYKK
jgi:hypothetical protein